MKKLFIVLTTVLFMFGMVSCDFFKTNDNTMENEVVEDSVTLVEEITDDSVTFVEEATEDTAMFVEEVTEDTIKITE